MKKPDWRKPGISETTIHPFQPARRSWQHDEFENIFNAHWAKIYAVLYRLTGSPEDADDLALEVFWRLWRTPPKQDGNVAGWLYRVAMNLGYNNLRSSSRKRYETEAGQLVLEKEISFSPEGELNRKMEREEVQNALKKMSPRQANLLILRHTGLSYREIADVLKLAP
ncbi:MAG: sigma-70 family RNA polymerase sigma factor, partial [Anaerolineaceae bacterium]|nr:sigma-70 family RNA polymerase sigma factor [Anaerolineaceae bacterium]